jgi:hypothetical protein
MPGCSEKIKLLNWSNYAVALLSPTFPGGTTDKRSRQQSKFGESVVVSASCENNNKK